MLPAQKMIVNDEPYTTADEDPFSVQPYQPPNKTVKHRRSSMLDKWITEQQTQIEETPDTPSEPEPESLLPPVRPARLLSSSGSFASASSPYLLAYPDLPRFSFENAKAPEDDAASIISYDLVDDDDIPAETISPEPLQQQVPVTPMPRRSHKSSRHSITPSFRSINLSFSRSSSPAGPSSPTMETASRAFARLSFFPRTPRSSTGPPSLTEMMSTQQHARSTSISTLASCASQPTPKLPQPSTSAKWRPSVLGHFPQSSISQVSIGGSEGHYTPSRPSVSSGDTYTTWNTSHTTTTLESVIPTTPSKISLFDSIRARSKKSPRTLSKMSVASTSSVFLSTPRTSENPQGSSNDVTYSGKGTVSQRVPLGHKSGPSLQNFVDDEEDLDPPPTYRFNKHETIRAAIPYSSSGSLPRVKFSSLNSRTYRKKKKLVISGIGVTEVRKFEGIKRWCESFGDIRNISRMPNGDLQIDFRDPEVADTVCRIRAKVFIAGVGSVQVSWVAGNKR